MEGRDAFSRCHPLVNFVFFTLVVVLTMLVLHPVLLAISLAGAAAYGAYLRRGQVWRSWRTLLPVLALTAAVNPLSDSPEFAAILARFAGNPLLGILSGGLN